MSGFFSFLVSLFWWVLCIAIVLGIIALRAYNRLQALGQRLREASSNTEVAVSRKLSLINQLIDVVRNYQDFEQFTHLKVSGNNTDSLSQAWSQAGHVLSSIQGIAQRFPDLRASEQYSRLAESIQESEQAIMQARERYNACVREYNTARSSIPTIFVARFMGFSEAPYLEFDHSGVAAVTTLKEFKTGDGERLQQMLQETGNKLAGGARTLAATTVQAGQALQGRMQAGNNTSSEVATTPQESYFFMQPGGVPQGPIPHSRLLELIEQGELGDDAQVALAGSNTWQQVGEWRSSMV